MLNEIKLSIVIPVYNMEEYIEDCLTSVFNQKTSYFYEVIIVNDGSTDSSITKIDKLILSVPSNCIVKLITIDNSGVSVARNLGIANSTGAYISFVDSDDWVDLLYVDSIVGAISLEQNTDILYFDRVFSFEHKTENIIYPVYEGNISEIPKVFSELNYSACNKAFSKKLFKKGLRFPLDRIYEDAAFSLDALIFAEKIKKIQGFLYFVRQDTPNSTTNKLNERELDLLWIIAYCDEKINILSESVKSEYALFKYKTLAYWVVKLVRNNAVFLLSEQELPSLPLSSFNTINEKVLAFLINVKWYKVLSLAVKLNDILKK